MACALVWLRGPDSLLQAVVGFGLVISSVAGSHLLMNLRDAYSHPTGETTIGRSDYSRADFGEVPTVHRGKNIFANEGRHHINGELDTSWALDSTQVRKYNYASRVVFINACRTTNPSYQPNFHLFQPFQALRLPSRKHERFNS